MLSCCRVVVLLGCCSVVLLCCCVVVLLCCCVAVSVSYRDLTLPTKRLVVIAVVAVWMKKKKSMWVDDGMLGWIK